MNNDPVAIKLKFIDDLSIATRINLAKDLVSSADRPQPYTFEERLGTVVSEEANAMQRIVDGLAEFADKRQMVINCEKSKVMRFSMSRTKDFPIEVIVNGAMLEVKNQLKILGVILTPNLKWNENTDNICKKAYSKLWAMRRMKSLGLDTFSLLDFYFKEVRVHLELAVPVWHSGLTLALTADIERVQRVALAIMLGQTATQYIQTCTLLGLKPLYVRRVELCKRFAKKTAAPESRHSDTENMCAQLADSLIVPCHT